MKFDIIILSGGYSSRMKSDKALLITDGKTIIEMLIEKLQPFANSIHIILGKNFNKVSSIVSTKQVLCHFNENHDLGMFSSIQKGFSEVSGVNPILLQMIDQPFLPTKYYQQLTDSYDQKYQIIQPIHYTEKRKGHPIIFSHQMMDVVRNFNKNSNLREVFSSLSLESFKLVEIDDKRIFQNINTPQEWENYKKNTQN